MLSDKLLSVYARNALQERIYWTMLFFAERTQLSAAGFCVLIIVSHKPQHTKRCLRTNKTDFM